MRASAIPRRLRCVLVGPRLRAPRTNKTVTRGVSRARRRPVHPSRTRARRSSFASRTRRRSRTIATRGRRRIYRSRRRFSPTRKTRRHSRRTRFPRSPTPRSRTRVEEDDGDDARRRCDDRIGPASRPPRDQSSFARVRRSTCDA